MPTAAEIVAHENYIFNLPTHDRIVELNRYVPTLTEAEKAIFYQTNVSHAAAVTAQYDRERAEARKEHEWKTWTSVAGFGLAGAALTPVVSSVFGGSAAGTALAPSGASYITEAGLPASLQVPAGMEVTASGLPYITDAGLPASIQAPAAITAQPGLLDKIWTAGKDMGGIVSAALGYGKELQQILSPVFQTQYPTEADTTGSAEYTKLADQGKITGFTMPGEVTPGETGPNTLYIIGGIVLLFLLMRRVKR